MDNSTLLKAYSFPCQTTAFKSGHCLFHTVLSAAFTLSCFVFHQFLFKERTCCPGRLQIPRNCTVSQYKTWIKPDLMRAASFPYTAPPNQQMAGEPQLFSRICRILPTVKTGIKESITEAFQQAYFIIKAFQI